jgi:hypothetical protein
MRRTDTQDFVDGMKPFFMGAAALFVFGILVLLVQLQSPSFVQWDGIGVHGDTYRGVTTYTYNDETYSIDNTDVSVNDTRHIPTTVWLPRSDPDNPEKAFIESAVDRWTDFVFLTIWFFGVAVVLAIGMVRLRLRRRRRDREALTTAFGIGLDPEIVERLLAEGRRPPEPRTRY